MLTAFLGRSIVPPIRFDRDLFLAFGANDHFFAFGTDNNRASRLRMPFLAMEARFRAVTGTVSRATLDTRDDFVMFRFAVFGRRPSRRLVRTRFFSCPIPVVLDEDPSFIIRDVLIFVHDVFVFRDDDLFRARYDDRLLRGRDNSRRLFHDDCLLDDLRSCFHDDRSRTRFNDRAHQFHNIRGKLDAVCHRFMMVTGESCRSEDYRCGESSADNEGLVDGLLSRVSYW